MTNIKEKVLKDILKKGLCPDCDKKANECNCGFKELYATFKINDLKKALDNYSTEVGKVIDEITYGCDVVLNETACCGDISFGNEILLCNKCRVYYDKIQNIKQKLGIK